LACIAQIRAGVLRVKHPGSVGFAGIDVLAQTISRPVGPQDMAAYLEIKPSSGSVGVPLVEVLKE
jgi:hypothetical protein